MVGQNKVLQAFLWLYTHVTAHAHPHRETHTKISKQTNVIFFSEGMEYAPDFVTCKDFLRVPKMNHKTRFLYKTKIKSLYLPNTLLK